MTAKKISFGSTNTRKVVALDESKTNKSLEDSFQIEQSSLSYQKSEVPGYNKKIITLKRDNKMSSLLGKSVAHTLKVENSNCSQQEVESSRNASNRSHITSVPLSLLN